MRFRSRPLLVTALLLAIGVVLISIAYLVLDRPWQSGDVLYDVGMGALVATAVSSILALYIQRIERQEMELREERKAAEEADRRAFEARIESENRAREEMYAEVERRLGVLNADMDRTLDDLRINDLKYAIHMLGMLVKRVHDDVRWVRKGVDPSYTHPYDPLVDQIMAGLERMVEAEKSGPASAHPRVENQPE